MNDFSGNIRGEYPQSYNDWKEKTNNHDALSQHNDIIVNKSTYNLLKYLSISFVIILVLSISGLLYFIENNKFKTEINQTIGLNNTINNQYDFSTPVSQDITNSYSIQLNATIYLNPNMTLNNYVNVSI